MKQSQLRTKFTEQNFLNSRPHVQLSSLRYCHSLLRQQHMRCLGKSCPPPLGNIALFLSLDKFAVTNVLTIWDSQRHRQYLKVIEVLTHCWLIICDICNTCRKFQFRSYDDCNSWPTVNEIILLLMATSLGFTTAKLFLLCFRTFLQKVWECP